MKQVVSLAMLFAVAMGTAGAAPVQAGAVAGNGVLGADSAACAGGSASAIRVNISGLKDRSGMVKLELYPATPDDFLKDDTILLSEGKTFRRIELAAPPAGPFAMCIKAPRPGTYAVFLSHNRDGKQKFNVWQDGAGVPSNHKLGRSKPSVDQATVKVGPGVTVLNIQAQYLRGLSGFAPLKD